MKHAIFYEIMRKLKSNPALRRKLKVFAVVGVTCFLFVGGLAIWAGFSAVKYVATSTNRVVSSQTAQDQIQNAKTELQKIQFQSLNCWVKVQSLLAVQPWHERPVLDNLKNLKVACLESKPAACEDDECPQTMEQLNTAGGRTI